MNHEYQLDGTRRDTILDWQAIDGNILHFSTARDGMRWGKKEGGEVGGSGWGGCQKAKTLWKRENGKYWLLGAPDGFMKGGDGLRVV